VFLLSFNNVSAVTVSDLYKVEVAVDDQGEANRKLGVQRAFQKLLIKVSGHANVLSNSILVAAEKKSERYLQGFSYHQDGYDKQVYLEAWFSKALVIPLLKRAYAPVWGENRPLLLNWLAIESPNRTFISEQVTQWQQPFERVFSELGLPIVWPLADLEDRKILSLNQLWRLSSDDISTASVRYNADATLAGKIYQDSSDKWQYEGVLFHAKQYKRIKTFGDTPVAALSLAAANVSQYFAEQFAIKSTPISTRLGVRITVKKINSFTDYSQLLSYLQSITGVRSVEVAQVANDNVQLYLNLVGNWDKVLRIINLDDKLSTLQEKEFEWAQ
jgi:hypothetical protein